MYLFPPCLQGCLILSFFHHSMPIKTYWKEQYNGEQLEAGEHLNKATKVKRWAVYEGLKGSTSEETVRMDNICKHGDKRQGGT